MWLLLPAIAAAQVFDRGTTSTVRRDAIELVFTRRGGSIDVAGPTRGNGSSRSCHLEPFAGFPAPQLDVVIAPRPNEESQPYIVFCDGQWVSNVWVGPQNLVDLDAVARQIAERIVREVGVPTISIGINPREGLAGLDSWFWIEGYDGAPIARTVTELGMTVDVRIAHGSVRWDFGDGSPAVEGDLGRAYPARSTVTHVYTHRSASGPYSVMATFDLIPEYRVDGASWLTLPTIVRADIAPYLVREAQAVID